MESLKRPALFVALAALGGAAVLAWPALQQTVTGGVGAPAAPPIISAAQAQRQVQFALWAPSEVPSGGQMLGFRVSEPRVTNAAQVMAFARAHRQPHTMVGTGVVIIARNYRKWIFGLPGSPAARAGVGIDWLPALALNGRPLKWGMPVTAQMLDHPASGILRVTYLQPDGRARTLALRPERFVTRPPLPNLHHGAEAALILMVHGRSAAIIESRARAFDLMRSPPQGRLARVRGHEVAITGPDSGPTVVWTRGLTRFRLDNPMGALNLEEALQLIAALHPLAAGSAP